MITDESALIPLLKKFAKLSQANLSKVSCFILKNGAIISSGINHHPTGKPMEELIDGKLVSKPEIVHAEVSAINLAKKNQVDISDSTMLINISPCINCATEIAKTNISQLVYLYDWWDKAGLEIVKKAGINIKKLEAPK